MSVCCKDLLHLPHFSTVTLLAGSNGLSRIVSWPYVGINASISEWINGEELLFIEPPQSSASIKETDMIALLEQCIAKNLAGLVLLLPDDPTYQIPDSLLYLADQMEFPLFRMPWNVKLIDVTKEIIQVIEKARELSENLRLFLKKLLFSESVNPYSLSSFYGYTLYPIHFCCTLQPTQTSMLPKDILYKSFIRELSGLHCNQDWNYFWGTFDGKLTVLVTAKDLNIATKADALICQSFQQAFPAAAQFSPPLYLGISYLSDDPKSIRNSYLKSI